MYDDVYTSYLKIPLTSSVGACLADFSKTDFWDYRYNMFFAADPCSLISFSRLVW